MIEFKNVSFGYEEENVSHLTLDKFDMTILEGEFVAILGHNGSGKSTIAKLCNAILQPDSGDVLIDDMNTKDDDLIYDIRETVGMVFQNPDNQIIATTVEEDVAFGPENLGVPPEKIREIVEDCLKTVGIYEYRHFEPNKLSGGQKQRLTIAGALAMSPKYLVLDEPTAMLDPKGRSDVVKTIKKLNQDMGMTIVYITHFMNEAILADRIIALNEGETIVDGTPKEVFSQVALLQSVNLDVPDTAELIYELRQMGLNLPNGIIYEEECIDLLFKLLEG